eukprot:TRINITY_DN43444_c0_g1_i1.p1 TRINITY_DN43444_c0_g1~~TRINITY_DN43444_c0_g1_i1.p1  ORF type:complete len:973 (+),score=143.50 TRINITY_DN43444_c0_g1_i1:171-2921(+)
MLDASKAINGSLLVLARVIAKLTQDGGQRASHVPFRDSKLTVLLRDCLGGNCRTSLITTLLASNEEEAARTLRFASRATYVENMLEKESKDRERELAAQQREVEEEQLDAAREAVERLEVVDGLLMVPSRAGLVACNLYGGNRVEGRVVLLLHGCPGDSRNLEWMAAALRPAGFTPIGVDQPGFGGSSALTARPCHSSRSCDEGGPVDVLLDVLNYFGVKKACVFGYDWGGGIAISFASKFPKRTARLVLFHAMYNETPAGELARLNVSVDLLWVKTDQFHPLKLGKQLDKRLKTSVLTVMDVGRFDPKTYSSQYPKAQARMVEKCIAAFEGATGSSSSPQGAAAAPVVLPKAAARPASGRRAPSRGEAPTSGVPPRASSCSGASSASSAGSDMSADDGWTTGEEEDPARRSQKRVVRGCADAGARLLAEAEQAGSNPSPAVAGAWLRRAFEAQALPYLYACYLGRGSVSARPLLTRMFAALPQLEPGLGSEDLVAGGLWQPEEAELLSVHVSPGVLTSPRYFPGRRVAVGSRCVSPLVADGLRALPPSAGEGRFEVRTPLARIVAARGPDIVVRIETVVGGDTFRELVVPRSRLAEQNNPTIFKPTRCGRGIVLEDGVRCNWSSALMRARLAELSVALAAVVQRLPARAEVKPGEISTEGDSCLFLQREAVKVFRRHLNVTCLYDGVDRQRFSTGDAEKLMTFGCCHCHGLTSIMAAALLPFSQLLGIDVRYTGGFHAQDSDLEVNNDVERHQWLELTFRPSMQTFVCDLTLAGCPVDGPRWHPEWLLMPVAEAIGGEYPRGRLYSNGKPILESTVLGSQQADFRMDLLLVSAVHDDLGFSGDRQIAEGLCRDAFRRWDVDGDGSISLDELSCVVARLDSRWQRADIENLVRMVDTNRDGSIQYDEFLKWVFAGV